eukprot:scaffold130207_cov32-Tisochrysis_lutea.AAC.3
MAPLVRLEAEYDRQAREAQTQDNVAVRWDMALNKRRVSAIATTTLGHNILHVAYFHLPTAESQLRIVAGDELILRHTGDESHAPFESSGVVTRLSASEEIGLELKNGGNAPIDLHGGKSSILLFASERRQGTQKARIPSLFSLKFSRLTALFPHDQTALKTFAVDETSVSGYIYHRLLGHDVEQPPVRTPLPRRFGAPGLPELNHSQVFAVKSVLQKSLAVVQGPPGTGKTVTSASIVYHLTKQNQGQTIVCAPSNVAVDQVCTKRCMPSCPSREQGGNAE